MLPEFDLAMPATLDEALMELANTSYASVPIAGGTNLNVDMRSRRHTPEKLVNIENLPELSGIQQENGCILIGGGVHIGELLKSTLIAASAPALVEAARVFANPLIRNRATVGGNLADGSPAADTAPSLLVHESQVELWSTQGKRSMPLHEFFISVRKTALQPGEIIKSVRFHVSNNPHSSAFYKLGLRKADAISIASVAVYLEKEKGLVSNARIAMGSVAPKPIRAFEAEKILLGKKLTITDIAKAAEVAASESNPISDIRGSAEYRRRMVSVLTRRLLTDLAGKLDLLEI